VYRRAINILVDARNAFECLVVSKKRLPIVKGSHALLVTVTRPRKIWNIDGNNGRFRQVCQRTRLLVTGILKKFGIVPTRTTPGTIHKANERRTPANLSELHNIP
jgi:hypothetical protein